MILVICFVVNLADVLIIAGTVYSHMPCAIRAAAEDARFRQSLLH
jgi:hypothetical protein